LKRAAVDRHPQAENVSSHRRNVERERANARAYQALLLLGIGVRRSPAGKALLRQWADAADPELATAAWAALAMYGEPEATRRLSERAMQRGSGRAVELLLSRVMPPSGRSQPRRVEDGEKTQCSTCGRESHEVTHMMAGAGAVVCDRCVLKVRQNRSSMMAPDDSHCRLCSRSHFEVSGLYRCNNVDICSSCMKLSLGLLEREEVDRFLAAW